MTQQQAEASNDRAARMTFVRLTTILDLIPISRSHVWEMIKRKEFPSPVKLSRRISAWRLDEVEAWIRNRA